MDLNTVAAIATIICTIPILWGGWTLVMRFVGKKNKTSQEAERRWSEIQNSLRTFRPYFRGQNGRYLVGFRVPNTTDSSFTVRKVHLVTRNSSNYLLGLFRHVQLDGTDVQENGKPSWTLPAHLAGLWEMPGDDPNQQDLTILQVIFEIEFTDLSGKSFLRKYCLTDKDLSNDSRSYFVWGKTMQNIEGHTITQSHIDGNIDMMLTRKSQSVK
jgi:hypothetical protein